jgi:flagellar basal-body rod protein FlgG
MLRAINIAASGMAAQEANVNTVANNVANANTNGFKQGRTEFDDLLYQTVQEPGARSNGDSQYNVGIQFGSGAKASAVRRIHSQGSPIITNGPFDLMINGEGFFGLMMPNNDMKFTRDGSFSVDGQGMVVNKQGYKIFPGINIPTNTTSVNINANGTVDAYFPGQPEPQSMGQIAVFQFMNSSGLKAEGSNLLSQSASSGAPIQSIAGENNTGVIQQGSLEASNVNIMNEMTNMIKAQRAYEMNSKIMGIADQMMQTTNNIR